MKSSFFVIQCIAVIGMIIAAFVAWGSSFIQLPIGAAAAGAYLLYTAHQNKKER
jgi:hypothetical protein